MPRPPCRLIGDVDSTANPGAAFLQGSYPQQAGVDPSQYFNAPGGAASWTSPLVNLLSGNALNAPPRAPASATNSFDAWLQQHANFVFGGAIGMLVLAIIKGRR